MSDIETLELLVDESFLKLSIQRLIFGTKYSRVD